MLTGEQLQALSPLVQDVARLLSQRFDQRARRLGLTRAQWALIAALFRREGTSQAALAEHLDVTPISLGRLVERMERAGWVERRPEPSDKRAYRLYLTERAHRLRPQLRALSEGLQAEAMREVASAEQQRLLELLHLVRETLLRNPAPVQERRFARRGAHFGLERRRSRRA
jgi:DNA-binding MarR family transcriptional regulator